MDAQSLRPRFKRLWIDASAVTGTGFYGEKLFYNQKYSLLSSMLLENPLEEFRAIWVQCLLY
jgi:hypothetical protein